MAASPPPIDILCKVVDNFGDIGVAYRLARALSELEPGLGSRLRLVVEGLESFHALCAEVDPGLPMQTLTGRGWTVIDWTKPCPEALGLLAASPPRLVVECFACGRPDWYEEILFSPEGKEESFIVNLEYLTGEGYARDLHLMASATRSGRVRKSFFMPGFEAGTGGLILDPPFMSARSAFLDPARRPGARLALALAAGLKLGPSETESFWLSVFSYERDFSRIVADLAAWSRKPGSPPLLALVAPGKSSRPFISAWRAAGEPFALSELPFLPQETWDEVILASDFSIVRGEDSLSRAALSGRPFLWQAYVQDDKYQLVKVDGLLERMRPFFGTGDFEPLEALFASFNDRETDGPASGGDEPLLPFLERLPGLMAGFRAFSESLVGIGDLARALLTFLYGFV